MANTSLGAAFLNLLDTDLVGAMNMLRAAIEREADLQRAACHQAAEVAALRQAHLGAAPVKPVIAMTARDRSTIYVSAVSYADGPGFKVSRFRTSYRKDDAVKFGPEGAEGVARFLISRGYNPRFEKA